MDKNSVGLLAIRILLGSIDKCMDILMELLPSLSYTDKLKVSALLDFIRENNSEVDKLVDIMIKEK
jgi:hypothetical protein